LGVSIAPDVAGKGQITAYQGRNTLKTSSSLTLLWRQPTLCGNRFSSGYRAALQSQAGRCITHWEITIP